MGQRSRPSRKQRRAAVVRAQRRRSTPQPVDLLPILAAPIGPLPPSPPLPMPEPGSWRPADGPRGPGSRSAGFRPDIEGLRGLAVLLVVLFHGGLVAIPGGFVGVDVFFVISGFLITGLLLRERERSGSIDLVAFYARRARRILPAAIVVIAVVLPLAAIVVPPLSRASAMTDGLAAALSVGNLRFALAAGDYFATSNAPSPFLHFWSLGVEEQFYLAWPVLVILAGRTRTPRLGIGIALGLAVAGSFVANLVVSHEAVNWAFYSLPTRAWQLGIGGLLALAMMIRDGSSAVGRSAGGWPGILPWAAVRPLVAARAWLASPTLLAIAGWLGLLGVLGSALRLDSGVAYPGPYALVPTLGAAALLAGGAVRNGPGAVLRLRPLRFVGRISYSLYLWHWPILVLPAVAVGSGALDPGALGQGLLGGFGLGADGAAAGTIGAGLALPVRVGLVGLAILVATITCLAVEEPFRHRPSIVERPRRTLGLAFASVLSLVLVAATLSSWTTGRLDGELTGDSIGISLPVAIALPVEAVDTTSSADEPAWPDGDDPSGGSDVGSIDGSPDTAATDSPDPGDSPPRADSDGSKVDPASVDGRTLEPAPRPANGRASTARAVSGPTSLPRDVRPALGDAHEDRERLWADGCLAYENATTPPSCTYGDPDGSFTIALVGDSHGAQWFPAFQRVARLHDWRLLVYAKVSCPFIDMAVKSNTLKREYTECAAWNAGVVDKLAAVRPDLTVVAMSHWILPARAADGTVAAEGAALARQVDRLPGRTVILIDTPHAAWDVPDCLAGHRTDVRACATPRSTAFSGHGSIERSAARRANVATIDLGGAVCPGPAGSKCPAVVDGMIVFRDFHHLTATFAASLAPALERALGRVVPGA